MSFRFQHLWPLVAILPIGTWLGLRSCERTPASISQSTALLDPAPTSPTVLPAAASTSSTTAPATESPLTPPLSSGLLSLIFRFEKGTLVESNREIVLNVTVRPLRRLEGQTGIYHRIVSSEGIVLFENVVPDPRRVPWDTTDDGKHLRGGIAHLEDMPLNLRLPAGVHGKLEVYQLTDTGWTRSTLDKTARLVGQFDL